MAQFDIRDEREFAEVLDVAAGVAWGAIKDWQNAQEGRPRLAHAAVLDSADDTLRQMHGFDLASGEICNVATARILSALDRSEAAIYL